MKYRFISSSALLATGVLSHSIPTDTISPKSLPSEHTEFLPIRIFSTKTSPNFQTLERVGIFHNKLVLPSSPNGTNRTAGILPSYKKPIRIQRRGRSGTVEVPLWKDGPRGHDARVSVGNQEMDLLIDTGSSPVWVIGAHADAPHGKNHGTYDSSRSNTGRLVSPGGFNIRYGDTTGASGDVIQETFGVGNVRVSNFQMNVASMVSNPPGSMAMSTGTMGLGYSTTGEPTLADAMAAQGIINSPAFSVWLGDADSGHGNILFGGIDTEKFHGSLVSLSIYPRDKSQVSYPEYIISFTSFGVTNSKGTDQMTFPGRAALLDTGHSLSVVPDEIANAVYDVLGTYWNPSTEEASISCSARNNEGSFDFGFGGPNGPIIRVPYREIILQHGNHCEVGIKPESFAPPRFPIVLGDSFMRSAYVVHDMPNYRIGLAQAKINAKKTNIAEFPSWGAPIPHAKVVQNETPVGHGSSSRTWIPAGEGYPAFGVNEETLVLDETPAGEVSVHKEISVSASVQVSETGTLVESVAVEEIAPVVEEEVHPSATNGTIEYSTLEAPVSSTSDTLELTLDEEEPLSSQIQTAPTTFTGSMTTAMKPSSTGNSTAVAPTTYPTYYATSGGTGMRISLRKTDIFGLVLLFYIASFLL